jgi:hypothetical protein
MVDCRAISLLCFRYESIFNAHIMCGIRIMVKIKNEYEIAISNI